MVRFVRARAALAAYLIISLSLAFLLAAVEPVRSFELKTPGSGSAFFAPAEALDYSAAAPQFVQNNLENTLSSLAPDPPRFFIACGIYDEVRAFFQTSAVGSTRTNSFNKKNLIPLKLRI